MRPDASQDGRDESWAKTLHDLAWGDVSAAVAERCTGPLRERLGLVPIAETYAEAETLAREAREAHRLLELDEPLPLAGVREVGAAIDRLERGGALDGPELRGIAHTLGAARVLRRFLARQKSVAPSLYTACSTDPTLDELQAELNRAVEPDGTLSDSASPELGKLRTEVGNLRARIVARLEQLLLKHADIIQDRFHTLREGRYVVPVRTDAHEKLPGIVHGTSGSGATVFVEPRAVVTQGNRLKMAQAELDREVARILGILSGRVRDRLASVRAAVEALDRADLRHASARLAKDLGAVVPELRAEPTMKLVGAKHPLLLLDGVDVIENDLEIARGRALVLSGPNAGGKTVSLKLLGLAALMSRAGLPVPAGEGSEVGFFGPVLTDIGDDQSLEKNLSTFSAHVRNVVRVLDESGERALVLLDELATGTDPNEGAALACAIVDSLLRRGAAVALTTHYERLKAMGVEDERVRNASVGFDVEAMAPTFEVRRDVPGSSSALAVAARFGMPEVVVERARALVPEQSRTFDALVRQLEERYRALDDERQGAIAARREAEELRVKAAELLERHRARDAKKLTEEAAELMGKLRAARAELKEARRALRRDTAHDEASLRAIREQLDRVEGAARQGEAPPEPTPEPAVGAPPSAPLTIGQRVYVPRLKSEVTVTEAPSKGRVRVASGPVKLWVRVDEVRTLDAPAPAASEAPAPASSPAAPPEERRTSDNTLDLRGMRVEDALPMAESFLDRLYGASQSVGFILHGVGSGALRDAVREHLSKHASQYVRRTRSGTVEEGGERWTVVYLR